MRADRLISILLILQQRKKMRAEELAQELRVSLRTIYRDLTVLSASGFPIYSEKGPGGGCCIVDDYRSSLSRITPAELNALKMINLPESLSELEMGRILQRALLKLYAAPSGEDRTDSCLFIDWNDWRQADTSAQDALERLYQAATQHRMVGIHYSLWNNVAINQVVAPYGIVAKTGEWYLIYAVGKNIRYQRIRSLFSVEMTEESFNKPSSFNLAETWKQLSQLRNNDLSYRVKLKSSPEAARFIRESAWDSPFRLVRLTETAGDNDCYILDLAFENLHSARSFLLGWGNSIEVLEPEPLRFSLADFARQVAKVYEK